MLITILNGIKICLMFVLCICVFMNYIFILLDREDGYFEYRVVLFLNAIFLMLIIIFLKMF